MLMVVLCFVVSAHAFSRNQSPTTLSTPHPERKASPHVVEGPVDADDLLDEMAMLIFGHNVSMIQHLYSITHTEKSYYGKPEFGKWRQDQSYWDSPNGREKYRFYDNVLDIFMNLAKCVYTRSQARKSLIEEWQKVSGDIIKERPHPALFKIFVMDEMAHKQDRSFK
ncbi:hypothetical protein GCK32_017439 [Trichostrongylus colubriformis]|uniref:Uncharacterized protein n=1 Tax=Trichostrongylus colubriformis TaxID=6319 RepID=A0AAN8FWD9_TRICO